jgi:hypothetical protein
MTNPNNNNPSVKKSLAEQAGDLLSLRSKSELVSYPFENGPRIATLTRSDTEEMRLNLSSFEGHTYLQYATWRKDDSGKWKPVKTQSIRASELDIFEIVIQKVREFIKEEFEDRNGDE